jgi:Flp pilus assembly pilin Flp
MKNPRSFSVLALLAALHAVTTSDRSRGRDDRGQTTAEYALVLLGAAGIAVLLVGWATKSGAIGALFDAVLDGVVGRVK